MWNYRRKIGTQSQTGGALEIEVMLKKELYRDMNCVTFECEKTQDDSASMSRIQVIFGHDKVREHNLNVNMRVKIFPPYLQLLSDKFSIPSIVGPAFLDVVSISSDDDVIMRTQ